MNPVIIIGTGLAGYSAARELRKHDKDIPLVLVSRDDGANYYKPDLSEAHAQQKRPDELVKKDAGTMAADLDATIHTHCRIEAIDRQAQQLLFNGQNLRYDRLVLACGAQPIRLTLDGDATEHIHKVNNLADYQQFRDKVGDVRHITIIGAGLIGCEFANDLIGAGYQICLVDPAHWALSQLVPQACGEAVQRELAHAGVDLHIGRAATGVHHGNDKLEVALDDGTVIGTDAVLCAVGLCAEVELARDAGLAVNRGIVVDRTLRTGDDKIYAIGDCAEVDGHWRPYVAPLMQCARTLGKTLSLAPGEPPGQIKYPVLPVIVKTHLCPTIAYPPVSGSRGRWIVEGEAPDLEARFVDEQDRMLGFALTGEATKKRRDYLKQAPPLLA